MWSLLGRLVCSVNVLYMELSYTGSLDQSTRASEHVTVQISYACKTTAGYHCFHLILEVYLTNLHILFTVSVVLLVDLFVRLVCSVNVLYCHSSN